MVGVFVCIWYVSMCVCVCVCVCVCICRLVEHILGRKFVYVCVSVHIEVNEIRFWDENMLFC